MSMSVRRIGFLLVVVPAVAVRAAVQTALDALTRVKIARQQ
jgi:hypothetical protein